ncbi:MAG: hypothetical protein M1819_001970 [Sarea resinae]|nr:MAG: hypothetical protein M1819_001970 [Sarea resinae]
MASTTSKGSAAFVSTFLLFCLTFICGTHAATPDQWRGRSIYQIITDRFAQSDGSITAPCNVTKELYCNGTWQGIIKQLDYIQGMGFTAIWISPVVKGIDEVTKYGQGYHGFWPQDIYSLNSHFGTADDLNALSSELHKRDMYLMVDIVANNFAYAGAGDAVDYSIFVPFNEEKYFHPFCFITNYNNATNAEQCWLGDNTVSLPDMNTELAEVQSTYSKWGADMVKNYSSKQYDRGLIARASNNLKGVAVDGFRADAAKHVDKPFWDAFQAEANVYMVGEVFSNDAYFSCDYMVDALDAVLNYPMWYAMTGTFQFTNGSLEYLSYMIQNITGSCIDSTLLGTFSENQDVARFASMTNDTALRRNVLAFTLLSDGVPIIYYGAEKGFDGVSDPTNREPFWLTGYPTTGPLYEVVKAANLARNAVFASNNNDSYWSPYWQYKAKVTYATDQIMVVRKGYDHSLVGVYTVLGENSTESAPITVTDSNFHGGDLLVEVIGCTSLTAGLYGNFNTTIKNGDPQVWVPAKYLNGSALCPNVLKKGICTTNCGVHKSAAGLPFATPAVFTSPWASVLGLLAATFILAYAPL